MAVGCFPKRNKKVSEDQVNSEVGSVKEDAPGKPQSIPEVKELESMSPVQVEEPVALKPKKGRFAFMKVNALMKAMGEKRINREKALEHINKRGEELESACLTELGGKKPAFKKLKKLIEDLNKKLNEEATKEAEAIAECDALLATIAATRDQKTAEVESLTGEIESLGESIAKLTEDISLLSKAVADLDGAVEEATNARGLQKETNKVLVYDARVAQTGVSRALEALKEFYADKDDNLAVVDKIDRIQADFAKLECETEAAEVDAEIEHETFLQDSAVSKAGKCKDIEELRVQMESEEKLFQEKRGELEGAQQKLDGSKASFAFNTQKRKELGSGKDYEEMVAKREKEIESLQQALGMLHGEGIEV